MSCYSASTLNLHLLSLSNSKTSAAPLSSFHSSVKLLHNLIPVSSTGTSSSRFRRSLSVTAQVDIYGLNALNEPQPEPEERNSSPDLKVFVGNLPFNVDSAALAGLFEQAGNVEMVEVIYDKITGRSRGFGFVTMSTAEEVEAAVQQFNGYELEGRALRVNSGPPPPKDESFRGGARGGGRSFDNTNRIYVGNLAWSVDNLALETLFSEQGKVMDAKVVYDRESGRSRGFGFVTYSSADEVNRAIESLDGADLDGRQIRVSVAEAPPRRQF